MTTDVDRAARLLRRAGEVEDVPPQRVWDAICDDLAHDPRLVAGGAASPTGGQGRAERRWSPAVRLLLAAAAGAGLMYASTQLGGPAPPVAGTVMGTGDLRPVEGTGLVGEAEVVERDGQRLLRVILDELPDAGSGYLEVWMLRPDASGLVTLGVLDAADEEFVLPAGLDLQEYPVVDISVEHLDGDPGHGGDSVVRGQVG